MFEHNANWLTGLQKNNTYLFVFRSNNYDTCLLFRSGLQPSTVQRDGNEPFP